MRLSLRVTAVAAVLAVIALVSIAPLHRVDTGRVAASGGAEVAPQNLRAFPAQPAFDPTPPSTTTTGPPPVTTEAPVIERPAPTPIDRVPAPALPDVGDCTNPIISTQTAMRESGCRWDAYNPTGCGGRGCIGFYQLDEGHFAAVSPWNPNVSGSCFGLDPSTREGQTECASRLGPGAWG